MNILTASTALESKRLWQNVIGFDEEPWNKVAQDKMFEACKIKFEQNPIMMSFLHDTQNAKLVEENPRDTKWSCGLSLQDEDLFNENKWKGTNWLGPRFVTVNLHGM